MVFCRPLSLDDSCKDLCLDNMPLFFFNGGPPVFFLGGGGGGAGLLSKHNKHPTCWWLTS